MLKYNSVKDTVKRGKRILKYQTQKSELAVSLEEHSK